MKENSKGNRPLSDSDSNSSSTPPPSRLTTRDSLSSNINNSHSLLRPNTLFSLNSLAQSTTSAAISSSVSSSSSSSSISRNTDLSTSHPSRNQLSYPKGSNNKSSSEPALPYSSSKTKSIPSLDIDITDSVSPPISPLTLHPHSTASAAISRRSASSSSSSSPTSRDTGLSTSSIHQLDDAYNFVFNPRGQSGSQFISNSYGTSSQPSAEKSESDSIGIMPLLNNLGPSSQYQNQAPHLNFSSTGSASSFEIDNRPSAAYLQPSPSSSISRSPLGMDELLAALHELPTANETFSSTETLYSTGPLGPSCSHCQGHTFVISPAGTGSSTIFPETTPSSTLYSSNSSSLITGSPEQDVRLSTTNESSEVAGSSGITFATNHPSSTPQTETHSAFSTRRRSALRIDPIETGVHRSAEHKQSSSASVRQTWAPSSTRGIPTSLLNTLLGANADGSSAALILMAEIPLPPRLVRVTDNLGNSRAIFIPASTRTVPIAAAIIGTRQPSTSGGNSESSSSNLGGPGKKYY